MWFQRFLVPSLNIFLVSTPSMAAKPAMLKPMKIAIAISIGHRLCVLLSRIVSTMTRIATAEGALIPNIAAVHKKPVPRTQSAIATIDVSNKPKENSEFGSDTDAYGVCQ